MYLPTSDDGLTLSFVRGLTSEVKDPAALSKAAWSLFPVSKERKVTAGVTALAEASTERSPASSRLIELIIVSRSWKWP